jgi:hypothetical protein
VSEPNSTEPAQPTDEPSPAVHRTEVLAGSEVGSTENGEGAGEAIEHPAKVMRLGTMMRQLLEEVRETTLDDASRDRLREIYDTSLVELGSALSPDLRDELMRLALPFADEEAPSTSELRIAKAQLVGWLEGLVQGIQATLFAQQMAAQQQLANIRGQLPGGNGGDESRPGTYL